MFFNMPKPGLGSSVDSSIENMALGSPEGAAAYLNNQNSSGFINYDEAALAVKALEKVAQSSESSRKFLDKWKTLRNLKTDDKCFRTIKLIMSAATVESSKLLDKSIDLGNEIYQKAIDYTKSQEAQAQQLQQSQQSGNVDLILGKVAEFAKSAYEMMPDEFASHQAKTTDSVNVREEPNVNAKKIITLPAGTLVYVSNKLSTSPDFTRILYNNKPAYIASKYLSAATSKSQTATSKTSKTSAKKASPTEIAPQEAPIQTSKVVIIGAGALISALILFAAFSNKNKLKSTAA